MRRMTSFMWDKVKRNKKYMALVTAPLWIPCLLYALWLVVWMLAIDYFKIPTMSMVPTLQSGDEAFVNKMVIGARIYTDLHFKVTGQELKAFRLKGLRPPKRGDVVVFNFPHHEGRISFIINNVYCKRILAIGGDSISCKDGHYVNNNYEGKLGVKALQDQLAQIPDTAICSSTLHILPYEEHFKWTIRNFGPLYVPRKGDCINITPKEAVLYKMILEWETGERISWNWERGDVYVGGKRLECHHFKHSYCFMAGDNVMDSNDSRYWGLVPEEYIVGVVQYTLHKDGKFVNISMKEGED